MADWTMKITHPLNRVRERDGYIEGDVVTSVGIVYAYSERDPSLSAKGETVLQIACNGRFYSQGLHRPYTQRGIVTAANRFAQEVANGEHDC